jgi:hypothetical protein
MKRAAPEAVSAIAPPQRLAVTNQGVDRLNHCWLGFDPLLQQSREPIDIELSEQQPEG